MKKVLVLLFIANGFIACNNCEECFVVEYETDGVTVKTETLMGEYCDGNGKKEAEQKAIDQGIKCTNCHVQCRSGAF